jgi:hypothetical protein
MAVQATRQEIVRVLRKTGFTEVAESPSVSLFQPVCGGGWLRWRSVIKPVIARRGEQHDFGLGVYRRVVEQGFALLHWFRRLRIRSEIRDDIHEASSASPAPSSAGDASTTSQTVRSS